MLFRKRERARVRARLFVAGDKKRWARNGAQTKTPHEAGFLLKPKYEILEINLTFHTALVSCVTSHGLNRER
jgi:hypothetical protein